MIGSWDGSRAKSCSKEIGFVKFNVAYSQQVERIWGWGVIMMEEVTPQKAKMLGPFVEQSPYFPNRTNMQLCKVIDRKNIAIEIYERGAGYTLASGTGACAAVAAAKRMGLVDNVVTVHMQGGDLTIEIDASDTIYMAGSVEQVGTFTLVDEF